MNAVKTATTGGKLDRHKSWINMVMKAGQDVFKKWKVLIFWIVIVVLIALEALLLEYPKDEHTLTSALLRVAAAVIPNFIAALVASALVYLLVRDDRRANYIKTMRSLRTAVQQLFKEGGIDTVQVQTLMRNFVPEISIAYFETDQPIVSDNDLDLTYAKQTCFTCEQPSPVVRGRCDKCRDILPSWREEEQSGR